jgi:YcaO-like protein with predicted kinase domain
MELADLTPRTRKRYFAGTHRSRSPGETLVANRPFMAKMGITRLANITGLDRIGLPVCVAVRPNSRTLATSQGKGETIAAAKASALMESIEAWHAERVDGPLCYDSYFALRERVPVVDATRLAVRADAVFHLARGTYWIEGYDLIARLPMWVPYETVAVNYVRQLGRTATFLESSNGLASGNKLVEAAIHGLCEVIERDAVTLWEFVPQPKRKPRQINLSTLADPTLRRLVDTLDANGIVLGAWDITSDIGIPTFTCTIIEDPDSPEWRPVPMFSGHGTHLVPEIALSRAIHEAIQSRLTAISGSRDDLFPTDYVKVGNRDDHARVIAAIRVPRPICPFAPKRPPVSDFFEQDLALVLDRLRAAGIDSVIVTDLTRADTGIPVVKIVVPGLEPYHTRLYRPGERALRFQRSAA